MENSTSQIFFQLRGLNDTRRNKQIYFAFTFILYFMTVFVNFVLIEVILLEKVLHEPMFIFLCNLCVNGIIGATCLYPKLLTDLISDTSVVSYTVCITQVFVIFNYILFQFTILTVMAYDRYVAICKPLEYHSIITPQKVRKLLLIAWLLPLCETLLGLGLTLRLPLCGFSIDKLYCSNWEVVKLSCIDISVNNICGYVNVIISATQVVLIVVSYVHIIRACLQTQAQQSKFMQTCLPHLITLINFIVTVLFDIMYARYGNVNDLQTLRNFLSVEFLIVPPLLNPLIYGLKLSQIRCRVVRMFSHKISALK